MIRVLLLQETPADLQTDRGVSALGQSLGPGFAVTSRSIGPGGDFLNVATAAVRLRGTTGDFDLVHAWGARALTAAAFCPFRRMVYTPTDFPTRRQVGWVRAVAHYRDVQVLCPTATLWRTMARHGILCERCHLVRPGVDFSRLPRRRERRSALRAALGIEDAHQVALAVGESTRAADHYAAAWACGILNVLDHRTRLLIWGAGPQAPRLAEFSARVRQPNLVTIARRRLPPGPGGAPVSFEDLLPAADVLLVSAAAPVPTLPIATAMASGVPIAATVTPTVAELLEDRHTALMVPGGLPRLLSQKILQLRADSALAWKLADMARTEAYEFFPLTRFLDQHRQAYRAASAGQRVEITEPARGAGLRFHGRA